MAVRKPNHFWDDMKNREAWFSDFRSHYKLNSMESLYKVTSKMISEFHGGYLLHIYGGVSILIMSLCPDYDWKFYKFRRARGYWEDIENQKLWFEDLREHYGFATNESLYELTAAKITAFYGSYCVIAIYDGSPSDLVRALIPEYDWKQYKFKSSPQGYWDDRKNIESWFEDLRSHYGLSTNEDLYGLTAKMISQYYGRSALGKFGQSKIDLVRSLIPDYNWKEYKFTQTRKDYWDDIENQKSWFRDFRGHYDLTTNESLYDVSQKMIKDYYGIGLLTRKKTDYAGSPALFIQAMCPEYDWDFSKFASNRKTQRLLFRTIKKYYPDAIWEYKTEVRWLDRNMIGFDTYIPSIKLAFEGQGGQHYTSIGIWGGDKSLESQIMRDARKLKVAKKLGIRVAIVPFCDLDPELPEWDSSWESLVRICEIQGIGLE